MKVDYFIGHIHMVRERNNTCLQFYHRQRLPDYSLFFFVMTHHIFDETTSNKNEYLVEIG